jgi:hypothetical protein
VSGVHGFRPIGSRTHPLLNASVGCLRVTLQRADVCLRPVCAFRPARFADGSTSLPLSHASSDNAEIRASSPLLGHTPRPTGATNSAIETSPIKIAWTPPASVDSQPSGKAVYQENRVMGKARGKCADAYKAELRHEVQ